ncbi:GntR family transcriptional regulator [bacterium]|nr:GntR family transcriptional regulator [candidate division CSSED10-310 bacterium]
MNITINLQSPIAIYRQIVDQIVQNLAEEQLAPGDQLPSIRSLSTELRINPNTVIKAYRELEFRGYAESRHGKGYFAAGRAVARAREDWRERAREEIATVVVRAVRMGMEPKEVETIVQETLYEGESRS